LHSNLKIGGTILLFSRCALQVKLAVDPWEALLGIHAETTEGRSLSKRVSTALAAEVADANTGDIKRRERNGKARCA
jgi:hypothetical protein